MGVAIPIRRIPLSDESHRRLKRLQTLAWLLDRSIPIGRWRIGLDPILGIFPGAGDWLGAVLSLYVVYESARLGAPAPMLARMGGNILVEAIVGMVPVLGDLFDFAWKANTRNLALIEHHYQARSHQAGSPRSMRHIWLMVALVFVVVLAFVGGIVFLFVKLLDRLLQ